MRLSILIPSLAMLAGFAFDTAAMQCPRDIHELLAHQRRANEYAQIAFVVTHKGQRDPFSQSARFEPGLKPEQRWVLLEDNGKLPGEQARMVYATSRADVGNPFMELLGERSLDEFELVRQDETVTRYRFKPKVLDVRVGNGEHMDIASYVNGEVTILRDAKIGCVVTANMRSEQSFSPRFGVNVAQLGLTRRFLLDEATGLFFPESSVFVVSGRAFLVRGFDILNRTTYANIMLNG